ncbi:MAG: hypothetical protein JW820_08735 [Spirochaetales bacterium]|nr:hypothetical protein [Spirochaetales bacterium]
MGTTYGLRRGLGVAMACFGTVVLLATDLRAAGGKGEAAAREKGIVLLVQFPGLPNPVSRSWVEARFRRQLGSYLREVSYGKQGLDLELTADWHTLPSPVREYRIAPRNLEVDKARVRRLIDDALGAADADVDFDRYSLAVIFMGAKVEDYGMVGLCGYPGMLGWRDDGVLQAPSGERVGKGVAIYTCQAHVGTLFHDIAHVLGGVRNGRRVVPCLYDHDLQARPGPIRETAIGAMIQLGFWDPMSCHYIERGIAPPAPCSWTRGRLGWIGAGKVRTVTPDHETEVLLGPLEDGDSETLVIRIPLSRDTYVLVENRQPIGCDRVLPGKGVLILYADDRIPECRHGESPVRLVDAHPEQPHLRGAAFDVEGTAVHRDRKHNLEIRVLEQVGTSCRVRVGPLRKGT